MRWAEVTVECDPQAEQIVSYLMGEACGGVAVSDGGRRLQGWIVLDDRLEDKLLSLREALDSVDCEALACSVPEMTVCPVEDTDWTLSYREYFRTFCPTESVRIRPPWEEAEAGDFRVDMVIDPGMAFGTGHHPTTKLMLDILLDMDLKGKIGLDVGAGSGILAIAAVKLGADKMMAVEIDPVTEPNARENIKLNQVDEKIDFRIMDGPPAGEGPFDFIVMNIVADVIKRLAPVVIPMLKKGGALSISGIIEEREEEIRQYLESLGLKTEKVREEMEWRAIQAILP